jgi:hypothetical protein
MGRVRDVEFLPVDISKASGLRPALFPQLPELGGRRYPPAGGR